MYYIKKVPLGTYSLKATYIGYISATIDSVTVDTSNTIIPSTMLRKSPSIYPETTIVISCRNYPIDRIDSGTNDTAFDVSIPPKPIKTVNELWEEVKKTVDESKRKILLRGGDTSEVAYILYFPFPYNPVAGLGEQVPGDTGTITGFVTDSATGKPIFGASVIVLGKPMGAKTDITGMYHIKRVPLGTYSLKATYIGYQSATIDTVTVASDSIVSINIALLKSQSDSGKLIILRGKAGREFIYGPDYEFKKPLSLPIQPKHVTTVDELLTQITGAVPNAPGQVFVRGNKAGEVAYIIIDSPYAGFPYPLGGFGEQVDAGKSLEATPANLGPTGTITGTITDSANGTPIVGAHVCVLDAALGGKTDSLGLYVIPNVPIGTYRLIVGTPDYAVFDMPSVTVVKDSTITVSKKLLKRMIDNNTLFKIKTIPDSADTSFR